MDAAAKPPLITPRRLALGALALGGVALVGGLGAAYLQREAIGVRLVSAYLRAHGVPASVHLDRLDLGGAAGSVRLGPWWKPDLVVPHLELSFRALPGRGRPLGAPQVRALKLVGPVLHGRWANGRLDFGTLQPLIDQALHAKPSGQPPPDLDIEGGRLLLDTPQGPVTVMVDAAVQGGRVRSLHARLLPRDLEAGGVRLAAVGGVVSGQSSGADRLHLTGAFGAARGRGRGAAASGLTLTLEALVPDGSAPAGTAQPGAGPGAQGRPVAAILRLRASEAALQLARAASVRVQGGDLTLDLDGALDAANRFSGRLDAQGRLAAAAGHGFALHGVSAALDAPEVSAGLAGGRMRAGGPFSLKVQAGAGRLATAAGEVALRRAAFGASGLVRLDPRLELRADGDLAAQGGLERAGAERLARPLAEVDAAAAAVLAGGLQRVRLAPVAYRLRIAGPALRLELPQGATATVAGGAVRLAPETGRALVQGRLGGALDGAGDLSLRVAGLPRLGLQVADYRLERGGGLTARLRMDADGDLGPARGARIAASARVTGGRGGAWTVVAPACAQAQAQAVRAGSAPGRDRPAVTGLSLQVCPLGPDRPVLTLAAGGWRGAGRVLDAAFALPQAGFKGRLGSAEVALAGGRGPLAGQVKVERLGLEDTAAARRVAPLVLAGQAALGGGRARGRLGVALAGHDGAAGPALGVAEVRADLAGGAGEARFDSGPLRLDPHGLQAAAIAPAAERALPQASGGLRLQAKASWTRAGLQASSGEVRAEDLSFKSPAGRIAGVAGDLRFSSLLPLRTAGVQTLTAGRLETVVPLSAIRADFALAPGELDLAGASAGVAQGRVSLEPMRVATGTGLSTAGELRLQGVHLQDLIAAFNLANAVSIQAEVDGALPFTLTQAGPTAPVQLRLGQGRVYAEGPGRLTIQRRALGAAVTTGGAGGAQPNAVQDFAYQALENLAFTRLEADVASRPAGRLGVVFHIVGRHDPKVAVPTRIGLFALLRGHAFDKPLPLPKGTPVDLTLDTSLNLDELLSAYGALNREPPSAKVGG